MPAPFNSVRRGASCRALSTASAREAGASRSALLRPSLIPRVFAAASASLVRWLICSRSCSANAASKWTMSLFACGLSAATKSTPLSINPEMKWTFLGEAIELCNDQGCFAFLGCYYGRLRIGTGGRLHIGMHGRLRRNPHYRQSAPRESAQLRERGLFLPLWIALPIQVLGRSWRPRTSPSRGCGRGPPNAQA